MNAAHVVYDGDRDQPGRNRVRVSDTDCLDMAYHATRKDLADQVMDRRGEKGWNKLDLASRSGVAPSTVSKVESGTYNLSLKGIAGLAEALGCTSADLLVPLGSW